MDTHQALQIFHALFLVNDQGEHPAPFALISEQDILKGIWKFNPLAPIAAGLTAMQSGIPLHNHPTIETGGAI